MEIRFGQYHLRPFRKRDVSAMVKHGNNYDVSKNLRDSFPYPYSAADAEGWVKFTNQQNPPRNLAIATDEEVIGGIGLRLHDDVHRCTAEVGYWLGEEYWGRGIATEALRVFTDYCFSTFALTRIYAGVFERNLASMRVLEKAGYHAEAILQQAVIKGDHVMDEHYYVMLR